jgi:hypothetical protein
MPLIVDLFNNEFEYPRNEVNPQPYAKGYPPFKVTLATEFDEHN